MSTLKHVINDLFEARYAVSDEKAWWDFVDYADWNKDHDYERIMRILMTEVNEATVERFEEIYRKLIDDLDRLLNDKVNGVTDDGYSDLLSHIVGSGKNMYYNVMHNWRIAQRIINEARSSGYTKGYKEGFQYIWHLDLDL